MTTSKSTRSAFLVIITGPVLKMVSLIDRFLSRTISTEVFHTMSSFSIVTLTDSNWAIPGVGGTTTGGVIGGVTGGVTGGVVVTQSHVCSNELYDCSHEHEFTFSK